MKREFTCDGSDWVAWLSGRSAYGTGVYGLGNLEAVHFGTAEAPDVPVYENLLAAGAFDNLFDEELSALLRCARRVVDASTVPERPATRRLEGLS